MIKERFFIISAFNSFKVRYFWGLLFSLAIYVVQVLVFNYINTSELYIVLISTIIFGILFCIYKIKIFVSDSVLEYFYIVKKYKDKSSIKWNEGEKNLIGVLPSKHPNKIEININKYNADLIAKTIKQIYFCTDVLLPTFIYMGMMFKSLLFSILAILSVRIMIEMIHVANKVDIFD